jgi:hypothetical protein
MKISAFIAIGWAVLTLGCLGAAQESNREMGSVDASVHASVEEQPREPESSQGSANPPATFSSWSAQPAKPLGTSAGWSAPATTANPAGPGAASKSPFSSFQPGTKTQGAVPAPQASGLAPYSAARSADKLRKPTKTGGTLSGEQVRRSSMFPGPGAPAPPGAVPFEIQEFPSPFKKGKSGLTDNFSQTDHFPGKGLKAKQRKPRPPRSMDFGTADLVKSTADSQH